MTAHPNPIDFISSQTRPSAGLVTLHPKVEEHFWGYELRMNETAWTMAMVWRALAGLGAIMALLGALGVLMMSSDGGLAVLMLSGLFIAFAAACAKAAGHGTQVRVQVDTRNGELREVVDTKLGNAKVLAQYGIDAVRAVRVVGSSDDDGFGQIHAEIEGYGPIPLADGAIAPLRALRDRIAVDCGLDTNQKREAEWSGPLNR